jgi:hypothetical protein
VRVRPRNDTSIPPCSFLLAQRIPSLRLCSSRSEVTRNFGCAKAATVERAGEGVRWSRTGLAQSGQKACRKMMGPGVVATRAEVWAREEWRTLKLQVPAQLVMA